MRRVVSVMPLMYDDIWTAAKGMYKLEPAVADGGELIIYAPHVPPSQITHYRHIGRSATTAGTISWPIRPASPTRPWGRSRTHTHLRGAGSYDPATGGRAARSRSPWPLRSRRRSAGRPTCPTATRRGSISRRSPPTRKPGRAPGRPAALPAAPNRRRHRPPLPAVRTAAVQVRTSAVRASGYPPVRCWPRAGADHPSAAGRW